MGLTELLFLLLALVSEVLGTVGGFGSSMFLVTLTRLLYPLQTVLAITAVLHVVSNTAKLWLFRGQWQGRLLLAIGVPSVVGVLLGAGLGTVVRWQWADVALGAFLILFGVLQLARPQWRLEARPAVAATGGLLAGFLAGWLGTGGAVRGLVLAAYRLAPATFIATSAAIDWGVDASRTVVYLSQGYLRPADWPLLPLAFMAAWVGSWLGKRLVQRMAPERFRQGVLLLVVAVGVLTVARALRGDV